MSKKGRERRYKHKPVRPDEYHASGILEMARFGNNTIMGNNRTAEQQASLVEHLSSEYPSRYEAISVKINTIKKKVEQCDPYGLLLCLKHAADSAQMCLSSEINIPKTADALVRAQEYIQSILVSTPNMWDLTSDQEHQQNLYEQIIVDFEDLYSEILVFYPYWATYMEKSNALPHDQLHDLIESQYMYWIRGNRYQFLETEPLKRLLPPHNDALMELYGVSADSVLEGLKKLQYSLSQGCADASNDFLDQCESLFNAMDDGTSPQEALVSIRELALNSAGKLFGNDLIDVAAITGWDERFINSLSLEIGEYDSFFGSEEFSGWPIVELPVMKKPFIKINGKVYAFLYYALFDNIYRIIQKNILRQKPEYQNKWKQRQTQVSEEMVRDLFLKLLPGAESHIGNYYPVKNSLKQMNENDIIIMFHNHLFIIEVKAGSFPNTPPITDFSAHITAYHNLAEKADSQCNRTLEYIASHPNAQFYNSDKKPSFSVSNLSSYDDVFTFSVTVDNFNEFAAKAEKLSIISLKRDTIVLSYDDLLVYAEYFDSPIYFLHYLKQRKAAIAVPQFQMHDELDHLGLYIDQNCYAMNPSQYGNLDYVFWDGFREELDIYFSMLYIDPNSAEKPIQKIDAVLLEILKWIENKLSPDNLRLAYFILNWSSDARASMSAQIRYALKRQRELRRASPILALGDNKCCIFVSTSGKSTIDINNQRDYVYAIASRNESVPVMWIMLEYDDGDRLISVWSQNCYFGDLNAQDAERIRKLGDEKAKAWIELAKRKNGKLERNGGCPCGSGKKYKNCCLRTK